MRNQWRKIRYAEQIAGNPKFRHDYVTLVNARQFENLIKNVK